VIDYHEGDDGTTLTGEAFTHDAGSETAFHSWGTRNGVGFDETSTTSESDSRSFALPGGPTPITPSELYDAYPFDAADAGQFLVGYGGHQVLQPPTSFPRGRVGMPQDWYNR
jgi:hypothetical protein